MVENIEPFNKKIELEAFRNGEGPPDGCIEVPEPWSEKVVATKATESSGRSGRKCTGVEPMVRDLDL